MRTFRWSTITTEPSGSRTYLRLSLWDPENTEKYIGDAKIWESTQEHLRSILVDMGVPFVEEVGEAAFYGPKIDIQFTTALGREESMSTIQLISLRRTASVELQG